MRANPEPKNRTGLALNANRTIVASHSYGHDRPGGMHLLVMEAWVPRVLAEEQICRNCLLLDTLRKAGKEFTKG